MGKTNRKKKLERRKAHDPAGLKLAKAIKDTQAEIDEMNRTLSGCDWCCGGGEARMERLLSELAELKGSAKS